MVSVIIPTFNRSAYLRESIQSIISQSINEFEIIIIDDGSTDNTFETVNSFDDSRIIYINDGKIGNISKLRNKGIKIAKYDLIAFCDDDDIWLNEKLKKQLLYVNEYGIVCSNAKIIDNNSNIKNELFFNNIDSDKIITTEDLLSSNYVITSSVLMKKSFLNSDNTFDEYCLKSLAEDYDLWIKVSFRTRIKYINEPLIQYRIHDNITYRKNNFPVIYLNSIKIVSKYIKSESKSIRDSAYHGKVKYLLELLKLYGSYRSYYKFIKLFLFILFQMKNLTILKIMFIKVHKKLFGS